MSATMKLSEAILLGSIGSEQGKGMFINGNKTCALGAAFIAIGEGKLGSLYTYAESDRLCLVMNREWPQTKKETKCPVCNTLTSLHMVIGYHLNDQHQWTRPQIAAWVATIEPQDEVIPEPGTLTDNINLSALVSK